MSGILPDKEYSTVATTRTGIMDRLLVLLQAVAMNERLRARRALPRRACTRRR